MTDDGGIPERLGGYRLDSLLGRGGMGEVFLAWDERLHRRVALKRVLTDPRPDKRSQARFRREARAAARLNHSSIVQIHDLLETDQGDVMVMEFVEGRGLTELIAEGQLDLDAVLRLGAEIADGLAEAHKQGLVHRDLKAENVRVTLDGHAKILDFGVARLLWSEESDGDAPTHVLTRSGALVGTIYAMSPEQANGLPADHRSDLFALGGLLYQMLTGHAPFRGRTTLDTLRRILSEKPRPLAELRPDLPPDVRRLVAALLAKAPADRPPNARVVADTLERLRESSRASGTVPDTPPIRLPLEPDMATEPDRKRLAALPTGEWPSSGSESRPEASGEARAAPSDRRARRTAAAAALALAALAAAVWWAWLGKRAPAPAGVLPAELSSIGVLYFQNVTGDAADRWMRQGIAKSLATQLAETPALDVLPDDRLYEILGDLGALDAPPSSEILREVAERGPVGALVLGDYTRVGDQLEISARLETALGETLVSTHARDHRDRFFRLVDELAAAVRGHYETGAPRGGTPSVTMVTTDSIEAWRYHTEALALMRAAKLEEAEVLLRKAIEVDPEFALAYANLGTLERNLGKAAEALAANRRAVELADRLPRKRRPEVEGTYYGGRWSTYRQAIEAYRKGLAVDPGEVLYREHLGRLHAVLEQYDEAIEAFDAPVRNGSISIYSAYNAACSYAAVDRLAAGERVLQDLSPRQGGDWLLGVYRGWYAQLAGDLEAADEALGAAELLRPGSSFVHFALWRLSILRRDWPRAEQETAAMLAKSDPYSRWVGAFSAAVGLLYRGRSADALERLEEAARAYPAPDPANAQAHCWRAELLLARGEADAARTEARQARQEGEGYWPELEAVFVEALAEEALGRTAAADALAALLEERRRAFPNPVEERQILHLQGRRALLRGDAEEAVRALGAAAALLPPRGVAIHGYLLPDHVPVWTALGEAQLLAGDPRAAAESLAKAARSGSEHVERPVPWISAFFLLGRAHRQLGDEAEARRSFDRFLSFWRDADLAHPRIEEAR